VAEPLTIARRQKVTVEETGEEMTLLTEESVKGRRPSSEKWDSALDEEYIMAFPNRLAQLGLSGREMEVLFLVAQEAKIDSGVARFSSKEIGAKLGTSGPNISALVIQLIQKGVLERVDRAVVRLNPLYVWRGSRIQRRAALNARELGAK
jgi:DNA-binding CsgD family transcriptional regulator